MKTPARLKSVLTINFILLSIVPVLIIGVASLYILSKSISSQIKTKNFSLATSVAGEVETFLREPLSLLKQIDEVSGSIVTDDKINRYLNIVLSSYPFFEMIQLLDDNGTIKHLAPFNEDYVDIDMSSQPFFKLTTLQQKATWSPTFISMQSGHPTITVSFPSVRGGVVVGYVDLSVLSAIVAKVSDEHSYAIIVDQEGTMIAGNKQRVLRRVNLRYLEPVRQSIEGNYGTFIVSNKGEKQILSSVGFPLTGWIIIHIQHYNDAFAPAFKIRQMLILGVFITLLLAMITAVFRAQSILAPLSQLISRAKEIAGGNYDTAASHHYFAEIDELDNSFMKMATSIREREQSIKESEMMHRNLIEAIPYGVQEADVHGTITFANSAYNSIFEIKNGHSIGKSIWYSEATPDQQEVLKEYLSHLVKEQPVPTTYYTQARTEEGRLIDIQVDWQYNFGTDGTLKGFTSVITDITEKKQLEDSLRQAQKMEAIGTLAGGIAHDFNNILAAILGYSELVLDDLPPESEQYEHQQHVIQASHRARDLVQHLLLFSRKQEHEKGPVNIHLAVKEALDLLRATLPTTLSFEIDNRKDCGTIEANPTQIHQVILNLCTNAAHSMEDTGGVLSVSSAKVFISEEHNKPVDMPPGQYTAITIADTGTGIPAEDRERIFEPFFTTKETGKGTGMGLAVVHGIVASHNGHITVGSEPGHGTTFTLYFPSIDSTEKAAREHSDHYSGNGEHILVVDDEEAIVNYTAQVLTRLGYTITTATESPKALASFLENPDAFDLVITDQTMPNLTGYDMARQMLKTHPETLIILCTGFSSTVSAEAAKSIGIANFAMKPLTRKTLSCTVWQTLHSKPSQARHRPAASHPASA